jgi:hypothetical protein
VREGRLNRYMITAGTRFRHTAEADHEVAGLLDLINGSDAAPADERRPPAQPASRNAESKH